MWQITCMFDNFNNFSIEERHKLSACESLHSWSSYHLALCPIAGNQMLLVMVIAMMISMMMTMIFYSPPQRVFQSSEVFLFPDDCAQSSLVPVWQSSLPFCQVFKTFMNSGGDNNDHNEDFNISSLVQPAAICASSFTLVAICSERWKCPLVVIVIVLS